MPRVAQLTRFGAIEATPSIFPLDNLLEVASRAVAVND
jgi:hypothetical protein